MRVGLPLDADHRLLYRGLLTFACYHVEERKLKAGQGWNLKRHYGTYAVCSQSIGKDPSPEAVGEAFERFYPGRKFEKANVVHIVGLGLKRRAEIEGLFRRLERQKPHLKKVFWDARLKGMRDWEKWRIKHAGVFKILDPITEKLQRDIHSTPPTDCLEKLLELRVKLIQKIKPKNASDIRGVRVGNPLHYQIIEALTYCYLGKGRIAKAFQEAGVLIKEPRRIRKADWAFMSIQDALIKAKKDLRDEASLDRELPGWKWPYRLPSVPRHTWIGQKLRKKSRNKGNPEKIGESESRPAVLSGMKKKDGGVLLSFRKIAWRYPQYRHECRRTNRVEHYEISGNRLKPIYGQSCKRVGKPIWINVKYQEKPLIVPAEDAALLKKGMFLEITVNKGKEGDAAITNVHLVKNKRFKGKQKVMEGIRLW